MIGQQMANRTILFIDDDRMKISGWIEALEAEFSVVHIRHVDSIPWLVDKVVEVGPAAVVQDVMMPNGDPDEIDITAGLTYAEGIRECASRLGIPVVLFSNRMLSEFSNEAEALGYPKSLLHVKFKPEIGYLPFARFILSIAKK